MPLLPSALPPKGEARRYVANDFLNLIALPAWERGAAERRSGAFINRLLETLLPARLHAASALSAPVGHLPLEGKAGDTGEACHRKLSGIAPYIFAAKPPPSFLIRAKISSPIKVMLLS